MSHWNYDEEYVAPPKKAPWWAYATGAAIATGVFIAVLAGVTVLMIRSNVPR